MSPSNKHTATSSCGKRCSNFLRRVLFVVLVTVGVVVWDGRHLKTLKVSSDTGVLKDDRSSSIDNHDVVIPEHFHPVSKYLLSRDRNKIFLYEVGEGIRQGFGSFTINMLLLAIYLEEGQGRTLVVDTSHCSKYRWNETLGVYTGFFQTKFPVIDNGFIEFQRIRSEVESIWQSEKELDVESFSWIWTNPDWFTGDVKSFLPDNKNKITVPDGNKSIIGNKHTVPPPVLKVSNRADLHFLAARDQALTHYGLPVTKLARSKIGTKESYPRDKLQLYHRMTQLACQTMRLHPRAKERILQILQESSIPSILWNGRNDDFSSPDLSVSFHIRRGDKVYAESRMFPVGNYCKRFVNTLERVKVDKSRIKYCFVATDDYVVVDRLRSSLANYDIPCTLYALAPPAADGTPEAIRGRQGFETLLAEMAVMTTTTYFMGTFNSNIGAMVTLYRACGLFHLNGNKTDYDTENDNTDQLWNPEVSRELNEDEYGSKIHHFYNSFGVDNPFWYIP